MFSIADHVGQLTFFSGQATNKQLSERAQVTSQMMKDIGWTPYPAFKPNIVIGPLTPSKITKALLSDIRFRVYTMGEVAIVKYGYTVHPIPEELYDAELNILSPDVDDLRQFSCTMYTHWLNQICTGGISMANKIEMIGRLVSIKVKKKTPYVLEFLESKWDFRNLTVTTGNNRVMKVLKMHFIDGKLVYGDKAMLMAVLALAKSCQSPEDLNRQLNNLTSLFRIEDNYGAPLTEHDSLYQIRDHHLGLLGVDWAGLFPFFRIANDTTLIEDAVNACISKGWSVTTDKYGMKSVIYGPGSQAMCIFRLRNRVPPMSAEIEVGTMCDASKVEKMLNRPSQFFGSPYAGASPFGNAELDVSALKLRLTPIDYSRESYVYSP